MISSTHTHTCTHCAAEEVGGGELGDEEGGGVGEVDSLTDMYENMPPLEKLERYFQSEDVLDRYVYIYTYIYMYMYVHCYMDYMCMVDR